MKTKHLSSVLMAVVLLTFTYSCQKDQQDNKIQKEDQGQTIYRMSIVDNEMEVEAIDKEQIAKYLEAKQENDDAANKNGNSQKVVGLMNMFGDMATFNAIKNNGGVHGNTHYSGVGFIIDMKFDSECLLVLDNKAYWGGTITEWNVADPDAIPIGLGWQIFWSALDHGEGNNADPDQMGDAFIIAPPGLDALSATGFETWCEWADFDYNLYIEGGHQPHGYIDGDDPTNIQITD